MNQMKALFGPGADRYPLLTGHHKDVTEALQQLGPEEFDRQMDFLEFWAKQHRVVLQHETPKERIERLLQESYFLYRHVMTPQALAAGLLPELRELATPTVAPGIPPFPADAMVGALGELAEVLTEGSQIPKHLVFMSAVVIVGLYASGELRYLAKSSTSNRRALTR